MAERQQTSRQRVGFIGLGNQGGPIARQIGGQGWPLRLWARRPAALDAFDDIAERAETVELLAASVDILCLCVVDDTGVVAIVDRALPAMAPGSLIAILSTIHPDTCETLSARASTRGVQVIDAPVSGGGDAATAGKLTVMMGGDPADCERVRPVFESFGGLIVRLGGIGAGQRAKLVNNALLTAILELTQAAREGGAALGLDTAALDAVIAVSSGRSFGHEVLRRTPDLASLAGGAALLRKDLALLRQLTEAGDVDLRGLLNAGDAFIARFPTGTKTTGQIEDRDAEKDTEAAKIAKAD